MVSVTSAGVVGDKTGVPELEVTTPAPALEVGATSTEEDMGKLLDATSVLETWLAWDVQVVLLQDCGLVESLMLLLLSVDETMSVTVDGETELTVLDVQVELPQEVCGLVDR